MSEPFHIQNLRATLDNLDRAARSALRDAGYTEREIDAAAGGQIIGRLHPADEDGEHVSPAWWQVEALREVRQGQKALQRADTQAAERHCAEARERVSNARMEALEKRTGEARSKGGKGRRGKVKPITDLIGVLVETMQHPAAETMLAEFEADAENRESVLHGLREDQRTAIRITRADADGFEYIEGTGRHDSMSVGTLRNAISKAQKPRT